MVQGLTAQQVTNLAALPALPQPGLLSDIIAVYRTGLPDPAYQETLAQALASFNPSGTTATVTASENIAAGDLVNIWNNAGTANVRRADGSLQGKPAHGFATAAITSGNPGVISFIGVVASAVFVSPGPVYLGYNPATPGKGTSAPNTTIGECAQIVGVCCDSTGATFIFQPQLPVNL